MGKRPIAPNGEHITYQRQYRKCGKKPCKTCEHSRGHGPYWYAYWRRKENGRITSVYIGKNLPPGVVISSEEQEGQSSDTPITPEPVEAPALPRRKRKQAETGNTIREDYRPAPTILLAALPA